MGTITINSNTAALNSQRRLGDSTRRLEQSFARLSSGLRINRASDDAAGLAVASALEVDRRVYTTGKRNLSDGLSLLSIAEGALGELNQVTIRINELAVQAANGALSNTQRAALDEEAQTLRSEFFRISSSVEFNGRKLFDAGFGTLAVQAGYGTNGGIRQDLGGAVGTGNFETSAAMSAYSRAHLVQVWDLNNDGFQDIFAENPTFGSVTILFGQNGGSFTSAISVSVGFASTNFRLGDLNNDGIVDMVDANSFVHLGNGDGTFRATRSYGLSGGNVIGDFNHDGKEDLVAINGPTRVALGNGDGETFLAPTSFALSTAPGGLFRTADMNNDGNLDVIGYGLTAAFVMLGNGDGSFTAPASYVTGANPNGIQAADFNNDGILDLATSNQGVSTVSVLLGNGDGTFKAKNDISTGSVNNGIAVGDLNGDGNVDIVTGQGFVDKVYAYLSNGNGSFAAGVSFAVGDNPRSVAVGDFNGDGVFDIVAGNYDGNSVSVLTASTISGVSPLLPFSLATRLGALQAMPILRNKLSSITAQLGEIGGFQARLITAQNTNDITRENFAAAGSQITDVDVAEEAATLVKQRILQQAGTAILAQANQSPALALKLLTLS